MPHFHFCDLGGHEWKCDGKALPPDVGNTGPSVCMCMRCQIPMEDGDHSECPIELVACPEHRESQQRPSLRGESNMFADALQTLLDSVKKTGTGSRATGQKGKE